MFRLQIVLLIGLLAAPLCAGSAPPAEAPHEVWVLDQSDTRPDGGGRLFIYPGPAVSGNNAANVVPQVHDFGGAARALALAKGQEAPRRPHMVFFNASGTHAIMSFVVTGHVLFMDTANRVPREIIDVGVQAHAAIPAPNEEFVLVANQNGKLVQRINTDYSSNTFALDDGATLNLAAGTTPNGHPVQDPVLRPDNAPISTAITQDSRLAFVMLRGGGLFVVDCTTRPMQIVAEYDRSVIEAAGFAGAQLGQKMYVNSGTAGAAHAFGHDLYAFRLNAISLTGNLPNQPAPQHVYRRVGTPAPGDVDAHGMVFTSHGRYLWVTDRIQNDITVVDTDTDRVVNLFSLAGALSSDPAPDLLAISPNSNRAYATLRGSFPGSGGHAAFGSTPGLGVFRVEQNGLRGRLQSIAPIANFNAAGENRADPHGIAVLAR